MNTKFTSFLESLRTESNNNLIDVIQHGYNVCMESLTLDDNTYLRGEPISAMNNSLTNGIYPHSKRSNNIDPSYLSHNINRVSIGKGDRNINPSFMEDFFGNGKLIYIINPAIANTKGFKSNCDHPNSTEYLAKKISPMLITGIIVKDSDYNLVHSTLKQIISTVSCNVIKTHLNTLPIIKESELN